MPYVAFPQIEEDAEVLQERLSRSRNSEIKPRLHLLLLIKLGRVQSRMQAARHLAIHRNTIARWLKFYQDGGIERLLTVGEPGKPPGQRTVSEPVYQALQDRLDQVEGFASFLQVQQWLYNEYELEIPYKSVFNLVRYHMKAKLKRPRPLHPKKTSVKPLNS